MLTLRTEQLQIFEHGALACWVERMVGALAHDYPRQFHALGPDGARDLVHRALAKGRANHVVTQGGVAVLLELMVQFGEDFQHSPDKAWADDMLAHPSLPAQLKLSLMREHMTRLSRGRVVLPFNPADSAGTSVR